MNLQFLLRHCYDQKHSVRYFSKRIFLRDSPLLTSYVTSWKLFTHSLLTLVATCVQHKYGTTQTLVITINGTYNINFVFWFTS